MLVPFAQLFPEGVQNLIVEHEVHGLQLWNVHVHQIHTGPKNRRSLSAVFSFCVFDYCVMMLISA